MDRTGTRTRFLAVRATYDEPPPGPRKHAPDPRPTFADVGACFDQLATLFGTAWAISDPETLAQAAASDSPSSPLLERSAQPGFGVAGGEVVEVEVDAGDAQAAARVGFGRLVP